MTEKKYRVAVVGGAGMWGRNYLRAFAERPDCQIVALVDRARERALAFAEHYGVGEVLDSLEELLRREVPDVVATSLPVEQSYEAVLACAEAGVGVVSCEKPIASQLSRADEMVRVCRERGTAFACATAYWEVAHLEEAARWIGEGHLGALERAAIPGGLPREVSGAGCVQLTMLRLVTGREVEWVEGWTLPPEPGWSAPEGGAEYEVDCPAYGRLGLEGGLVCEIPRPRPEEQVRCRVWVEGEAGQAWLQGPQPVLVQGRGSESTPVYPDFLRAEWKGCFPNVVERMLRAVGGDGSIACSGHDYRQALEIALAIALSAREGHRRVSLPLEDRSLRLFPHSYRRLGGDVAGWQSIGYDGPPPVEGRVRHRR